MRASYLLTAAIAVAWYLTSPTSAGARVEANHQVRRHAAVGETVRLRGHVNYLGPCRVVIPTTITVVEAPKHGTLAVRDELVNSDDPALGNGLKCRGVGINGNVVYYSRTSPGPDKIRYDSSSENGVVHVTATVN